eukprot:362783-Chlamydomonas_euryale.AAC.16
MTSVSTLPAIQVLIPCSTESQDLAESAAMSAGERRVPKARVPRPEQDNELGEPVQEVRAEGAVRPMQSFSKLGRTTTRP